MQKKGIHKTALIILLILSAQMQAQDRLPTIPVALDAYRMWHQWPMQRPGVRAYMRSTYDRKGGNGDYSNFLFAGAENYNVTLDVKGKGILYFFRANHWHGSPWHFVADGKENMLSEGATADPVNAWKFVVVDNGYVNDPLKDSLYAQGIDKTEFIPYAPFPRPLNFTWGTTKGADLIWTPLSFERSMRIAYSRTRYGTGYYIYHLYANEQNLSQPIKTWNINQTPARDVLDLINRAGTDIAPVNIKKQAGNIKLDKDRVVMADIKATSSSIRAFKLTLPLDKAEELERLRLVITWDGLQHPSIDAPLSLFFGAGTLYNRENAEYLVKAFPLNIRYDYAHQKIEMACYFPMPFFKAARFELAGITPGTTAIGYEIRYEPLKMDARYSSYFHATYKDVPKPELGKDMVFLDTKNEEGQQEWAGNFVGTSFIFSHDGYLPTLEGDPRFFFDDSQTPQAQGTGTEEWGGGGDYWGGKNMTLPFAGHPCGTPGKKNAKNEKDLIESAYRFLLADLMPFGRRALIQFEHGTDNLMMQHYEAVTYWYGLPAASLIKTDEIDIGNVSSEKDHRYISPDASEVETISSRYEMGIDSIPARKETAAQEIYPEQTEDGRYTKTTSEFTIALDPANIGAMLRRTLDYSFPNQTAEVFVAETGAGKEWKRAGTWYLAGSNTFIRSDPKGELDNRKIEIKTSNRRFRQDEFLLPAALTKGKKAVRIKIQFTPDNQELYPGTPFPKASAWSELKYDVYSYIIPRFIP